MMTHMMGLLTQIPFLWTPLHGLSCSASVNECSGGSGQETAQVEKTPWFGGRKKCFYTWVLDDFLCIQKYGAVWTFSFQILVGKLSYLHWD